MTQKLSDLHERDFAGYHWLAAHVKSEVVSPVLRAEKTTSRSHVQTHMPRHFQSPMHSAGGFKSNLQTDLVSEYCFDLGCG